MIIKENLFRFILDTLANRTPLPVSVVDTLQQQSAEATQNDYLHKKFKRIASTAEGIAVNSGVDNEVIVSSSECDPVNKVPSNDLPNGFHLNSETLRCDISALGDSSCKDNKHLESNVSTHITSDQVSEKEVAASCEYSGNPVENGDSLLATSTSQQQQQQNNNNNGRNVCHYCSLNCSKPSVLEKHIRSHTNERPYPCVPCGFAFKTKSNLYKHCRSRAHQLRAQGAEVPPGQGPDDEISAGSDQELSSSASGTEEVREKMFFILINYLTNFWSCLLIINYIIITD